MSKILAIDCSMRLTGLALSADGAVASTTQLDLGRRQSAELPKLALKVMSGLSWRELDYIAITIGPGYFTGLRVAASYACGIAYACGAKIIPVSSLDLLARSYSQGEGEDIVPAIYSAHGFVYAQSDNELPAGEYRVDELEQWLTQHPAHVLVSDNPQRAGLNALLVRPSLEAMIELAIVRQAESVSPLELRLAYYRSPV